MNTKGYWNAGVKVFFGLWSKIEAWEEIETHWRIDSSDIRSNIVVDGRHDNMSSPKWEVENRR